MNNTGESFDFVYTFEGCKMVAITIERPDSDLVIWTIYLNTRSGDPVQIPVDQDSATWRAESDKYQNHWRLSLCPDSNSNSTKTTLYIHMYLSAGDLWLVPYPCFISFTRNNNR